MRRLAAACVFAAGALALWHSLWVASVTDDAGISLAYARNLALGNGLRLTPLSQRVEGFSNPLWVLWLAAGYALRVGGALFAKWSGALLGGAAVVVTGFVPAAREQRSVRPWDVVAPALLALDTTYTFWSGAGLETGAFALVLSAAMLTGRALPAGLLCVLRPEGPLYVAALFLVRAPLPPAAVGVGGHLSRRSDISPPASWRAARWLAVAALPLAAWVVFRRAYFGAWLPNTFYAKRAWDYGGFWYLNAWFLDDPWHFALYLSPLALFARSTRRTTLVAALPCVAAVAFIFVSHGDWMSEHRFAAHALPAAALAAAAVPRALHELFWHRDRDLGWMAAFALVALGIFSARIRSPERKKNPELPLSYVAEQGRWFRRTADRLGLTRPRVAHFDIGGVSLESGLDVVDLGGLADLYIGRVGYQAHARVREYVFGEVKPELINIHGPCQYLHDDPRLQRDYLQASAGLWGENWVRKTLELDGLDERCPPQGPVRDGAELLALLRQSTAVTARDLWLCARNHLAAGALPDVRALAKKFAAEGTRASLDAAVTLDPALTRAAQKLLEMRQRQ